MHRRCCQQAVSSVHYTTSCKHSLVLLRMDEIIGRNTVSWLKLLIKLLLLHLVGWLYYLQICSKHFRFLEHWTKYKAKHSSDSACRICVVGLALHREVPMCNKSTWTQKDEQITRYSLDNVCAQRKTRVHFFSRAQFNRPICAIVAAASDSHFTEVDKSIAVSCINKLRVCCSCFTEWMHIEYWFFSLPYATRNIIWI